MGDGRASEVYRGQRPPDQRFEEAESVPRVPGSLRQQGSPGLSEDRYDASRYRVRLRRVQQALRHRQQRSAGRLHEPQMIAEEVREMYGPALAELAEAMRLNELARRRRDRPCGGR
jgi:hypothetical protein